ncbi:MULTISPECIES: DUF1906 domain-containing protein [unclassified Pseudovibrio]|uniref:DUF1906 domain-containing protein n=1 Tax=unclassified Pseudovibrio TaxID=2627060 RepID=UPI0007AE89A3|nr:MULTISPECIES: DUF1906 domain-containing protein [unclassified Pseudovibrio]
MTKQQAIKTEPGVDGAASAEVLASSLAKKGYKAIGRYYSKSDWKRLTQTEAQQLIAAGLTVFTVYEDANNSAAQFSSETGTAQAQEAMRQAQTVIRQPKGTAIYFAVDYDASEQDHDQHIRPYFEAINQAFSEAGSPYKVGVYANGLINQKLLDDKLVDFTWLSQSTGFRNYQEFKDSNKWNILQGPPVRISGTDFDSDTMNLSQGSFGGFTHLVPQADT